VKIIIMPTLFLIKSLQLISEYDTCIAYATTLQ